MPYQRISKNPDNGDKEGTETIIDNNNDIKTEHNMRTNKVRITESKLRGMIREAVKGALNEERVWHNNSDLVTAFNNLCDTIDEVYQLNPQEKHSVSHQLMACIEDICNSLNLRDDRAMNGKPF